jgi:hypothetical protein
MYAGRGHENEQDSLQPHDGNQKLRGSGPVRAGEETYSRGGQRDTAGANISFRS